jgi:SAM-dependent methyltransferase
MSHRMVRCLSCDLVYVDTPPAQEELAHAYHQADYDSAEEANDAAAAYMEAISPTLSRIANKGSVLEIGTGTGVFLELLQRDGFRQLVGVEPSAAAIASAPCHRRAWIREGIFIEEDFAPASFDLVCCFMTMEHVLDPSQIGESVVRLLRPGGAFVTVTHDYRSTVNRAMGRRSPIIDIEHMQLFSPRSMRRLFNDCGFKEVSVKDFANRYALTYWMRLMPLPMPVKRLLSAALSTSGLGAVKIQLNVGNIITSGFKPS